MIVGIHQPNYLPYLGFFDKINKSDIFIIYDDAQFSKEDFQNRNKIRIYRGFKWLTVPVLKKQDAINQIKIKNDVLKKGNSWNFDHLKEITANYSKASYFSEYITDFEEIYMKKYEHLFKLNMDLINIFLQSFNIQTKVVFSSDYNIQSTSTQKIIDLVLAVGGDTYLSGAGGKNYLNQQLFDDAGITLLYQEFVHPIYNQCYNNFVPNMSSLDALFNLGSYPE